MPRNVFNGQVGGSGIGTWIFVDNGFILSLGYFELAHPEVVAEVDLVKEFVGITTKFRERVANVEPGVFRDNLVECCIN